MEKYIGELLIAIGGLSGVVAWFAKKVLNSWSEREIGWNAFLNTHALTISALLSENRDALRGLTGEIKDQTEVLRDLKEACNGLAIEVRRNGKSAGSR